MEEILIWFNGVTRLVAIVGGGLAGVCFAWAGFLWITSMGEPQKLAQARLAVIGVFAGLVIIGLAFAAPRIVSQVVIEPGGGMALVDRVGTDCDRILRQQLVAHRTVSTPDRVQQLVRAIQTRRSDCDRAVWNPVAKVDVGQVPCFQGAPPDLAVGGMALPASFYDPDEIPAKPYTLARRDSANNIIVFWSDERGKQPSDGSLCWLYVGSLATWGSSGPIGGSN